MGAGAGPFGAVRATTAQEVQRPRRTAEALTALDDAAIRVTPTVLAEERRLEVLPVLQEVFPEGLRRGSTVGVRGPGAMSLALATVAGPVQAGAWMATLGCDDLGLVAAEQVGIPLHRMILVDLPQRSSWGAVAAALVDAFDVVLISGTYPVKARDARRLLSRARERGGVIIDVGGVWPEATDVTVDVAGQQWRGLGDGHGVLETRTVTVEVSGRRGIRPRQVPLLLPGPDLAPAALDAGSVAYPHHAGADIGRLVDGVDSGDGVDVDGVDVADPSDDDTVVPLRPTG